VEQKKREAVSYMGGGVHSKKKKRTKKDVFPHSIGGNGCALIGWHKKSTTKDGDGRSKLQLVSDKPLDGRAKMGGKTFFTARRESFNQQKDNRRGVETTG